MYPYFNKHLLNRLNYFLIIGLYLKDTRTISRMNTKMSLSVSITCQKG